MARMQILSPQPIRMTVPKNKKKPFLIFRPARAYNEKTLLKPTKFPAAEMVLPDITKPVKIFN